MKKPNSRQPSGTDWERLSTMKDSEINLSDVPELDNAFFENATLLMPEPKKPISLRLDQDVVEWYRGQGSGYQTRMNAVLRMYMHAKTGATRRVPARRTARLQPGRSTARR
jgi:uncharacterized protein (DUF4415 family)